MADSDVYNSIMNILRVDQNLLSVLEQIVDYEKKHKDDQYFDTLGWEWHEVGVDPYKLMTLFRKGIIKVVYKSSKHTGYLLIDRDETRRALTDFKEVLYEMENVLPEEEKIPEDLFSCIVGYDDVKEVFRKSLSSDKPVHILLIGPPASAKTMFLLELERLPNNYFAVGSRASRAGLSSLLIDRKPRYLLLNEFDELKREDYAVILGLAQYGYVIETLYGRTRRVELKTWIFATANTTKGIPEQVLSRFLILTFSRYTRKQFIETVEKVLTVQEHTEPELALYIAKQVYDMLDTADPREAIRIARLAKTRRDVDKLIKILLKYR